MHGTTVKKKDN